MMLILIIRLQLNEYCLLLHFFHLELMLLFWNYSEVFKLLSY